MSCQRLQQKLRKHTLHRCKMWGILLIFLIPLIAFIECSENVELEPSIGSIGGRNARSLTELLSVYEWSELEKRLGSSLSEQEFGFMEVHNAARLNFQFAPPPPQRALIERYSLILNAMKWNDDVVQDTERKYLPSNFKHYNFPAATISKR